MTEQESTRRPQWAMCGTGGCTGVRIDGEQDCLAHVDSQARKKVLASLKPGIPVDLRGTPIDPELLAQVLDALKPEDGPPTLGDAQFDRVQFSGDAEFNGVQFTGIAGFWGTHFNGEARFQGAQFTEIAGFRAAQFDGEALFDWARFNGDAHFDRTHFNEDARFNEARFDKGAQFSTTQVSGAAWFLKTQFNRVVDFGQAQFSGLARFGDAHFSGDAVFDEAQFGGNALFGDAHFNGDALFDEAQFGGDAVFYRAQFSGDAVFGEAQFSGLAQFTRVQFGGDTRFWRTQFKRAGTLGPVLAASKLVFDRATFEHDVLIEVTGSAVVCTASRFAEAATLRLRYAQVVLDNTLFAKPSTIAFAPDPFKHYDHDPDVDKEMDSFDEGLLAHAEGVRSPQPRLLSLRGVDVATLTISEVDLAPCLFQGAHHLDQLRLEGARPFADTPAVWRLHLGRWWVPVWRRWSRRQTLAEEHHWRSQPNPAQLESGRWLRLTRPVWHGPACQTPHMVTVETGQRVQRLMPDRLAVLYRALRKAQEDSKNEPGAADFYYGEMEMRRRDRRTSWVERVIVWLYWLVAGYGLRAFRALTCLAAVVVGLAVLLQAIGFNDGDPGFRDALIYAAQSTISIASANTALTEHVSWAGESLRIVLRLVGPLLLGLALLSVRNRVKR